MAESVARSNSALAEARDAALESARVKSEFLANMSHEIRTPMNGVYGMTEILLETPLSDEQRGYAETVRRCADGLLTVINDVLDFSKIEAGKLELEVIDFDLAALAEDALVVLAPPAAAKEIELACLVDPNVPGAMRGDPGRLRQILLNLVGNAVKFTERGEVVVRVALETRSETHVTVRFVVRDTGIGIPEDRRHRLFQSFTQVDGSMTRRYGGTGLGLVIAKQLAELMGGEVGVESKPGRGSTFWFTARLECAPALAAYPRTPPAELGGIRVLVVDDNETNRMILGQQVLGWGMRGTCAAGGAEGLAILREGVRGGDPYRVVLLDMQMPEMDGDAVARAIREDEALASVQVVLLTSLGDLAGRSSGATLFAARLTKPVRATQLQECLVRVLSAAPVALPAPAGEPEAEGSGIRILLVEDDRVNQLVAARMLERIGLRVDVVANGREALAALERQAYHLVFMDVQMPEMDGFEATAAIRRREGRGRRTPIIAMTAFALAGDRERCLAAGMDDYLAKPVQTAGLHAMVAKWVGRRVGAPPVVLSTAT